MGKEPTAGDTVRKKRGFLRATFGHICIGALVAIIVGFSVWVSSTLSANRQIGEARSRMATVSRNAAIREAQVRLYESAIELERRNFGTANTRLKDAGKALSALPDAGGDARVARLQQSIAALDLTVVTDVSAQRDQVLALAEQAGQLVSNP
ncbi:MAG TPA: hypothetical protein VGM51_17865 [Armatimonadota bacterium]|jgi:hypothetical protein